jgi:CheY-like chemotaxis protein
MIRSKISCLLVEADPEDQELFLDTVHSIAGNLGCFAVSSGEEAFQLLTDGEYFPDIIFTEINLPGMDGFTLIEKLKRNAKFSAIPAVIYTSNLVKMRSAKQNRLEPIRSIQN